MIRSIQQPGTIGEATKRFTGIFGVDPSAEDAGASLPRGFMEVIFRPGPSVQEIRKRLRRIGNRLLSVRVYPQHHRDLPIRPVGIVCPGLPPAVSGHLVPRYPAESSSKLGVETAQVRICPGAAYAEAQNRRELF